jgi:hypothetical protein
LDDGDAALSEAVRAGAAANEAMAAAAAAIEQAQARLGDRIAESAKFAAKLPDYRALLAHRAATPPPLPAGRAERARVLAACQAHADGNASAFAERSAAFQAAHDPAALEAQQAAGAAAAAAAQRELEEVRAKVTDLKASAAKARDEDKAAQERNAQLSAACAGASMRAHALHRASACRPERCVRAHRPGLRDSIAAEGNTAATLEAELAGLHAALRQQQPAVAGGGAVSELALLAAAAAAARDTQSELQDACAAQRMELARLQDEARRAETYVQGQARACVHATRLSCLSAA